MALFATTCRLLACGDSRANALLPRLQDFPEYGDGWIQLGETLLRLNQPEAADTAFEQALQAGTTHVRAVLGKADALTALGRHAETAYLLRRNSCHWPDEAGLWHRLGHACYATGEIHECATALRKTVHLAPERAEAWFLLGLAAQDLGHVNNAARAYQQALSASPGMAKAALNLGICLQDQGDMDGAMGAYACALRTQPALFNRIAQALTSATTGQLWLNPSALRRTLGKL